MSVTINLKFNVSDKIKRIVYCGANMTHGYGVPKTEFLEIQEIKIIAGSPINRMQKRIQYICYNENTGKFKTLDEKDIEEYVLDD